MNHTILCASNNHNKTLEIQSIAPLVRFLTPSQIGLACDPKETGSSFTENALIKARAFYHTLHVHYKRHAQDDPAIVLAEDSGLCVEALDGSPGIYSARYGKDDVEYDDNDPLYQNKKLLQEMQSVTNRSAWFVCCAVLMWHPDEYEIQQAIWKGEIVRDTPRGSAGFGYDPIFFLPSHHCTSAELSAEQKNKESHRAKAIRRLIPTMLTRSSL